MSLERKHMLFLALCSTNRCCRGFFSSEKIKNSEFPPVHTLNLKILISICFSLFQQPDAWGQTVKTKRHREKFGCLLPINDWTQFWQFGSISTISSTEHDGSVYLHSFTFLMVLSAVNSRVWFDLIDVNWQSSKQHSASYWQFISLHFLLVSAGCFQFNFQLENTINNSRPGYELHADDRNCNYEHAATKF